VLKNWLIFILLTYSELPTRVWILENLQVLLISLNEVFTLSLENFKSNIFAFHELNYVGCKGWGEAVTTLIDALLGLKTFTQRDLKQ